MVDRSQDVFLMILRKVAERGSQVSRASSPLALQPRTLQGGWHRPVILGTWEVEAGLTGAGVAWTGQRELASK